MIRAGHIGRSFGRTRALDDVSFSVAKGEIVALMGANGAGKSTLFDIISTVDPEFQGEVSVAGISVRENPSGVRKCIGYVPGRFSLYPDLTVGENLEFFATAYGCSPDAIEAISPQLWRGLKPFIDLRAGNLSGGMKQKLAICCAMVHNPSVLLLDEPTVGVDPVSRHDVWEELASLRSKGVAILISTHYLDEAIVADKILFLHQGRVLLFDSPADMLSAYPHRLYALECPIGQLQQVKAELSACKGVRGFYLRGGNMHIAADGDFAPGTIAGHTLRETKPTIEDVFIDKLSFQSQTL